VRDLARNAAAVAGVRHQHAIAAGKAEIGGQRRALVAAFFLDDLDQQNLTALDHVLDLVAAAQSLALLAQFVGGGFVDRRSRGAGAGLGRGLRRFRDIDIFGSLFLDLAIVFDSLEFGGAQPFLLGGVLGLLAKQ